MIFAPQIMKIKTSDVVASADTSEDYWNRPGA